VIVWVHQFRPRSAWYSLDDGQQEELRRAWDRTRASALAAGNQFLARATIRGQSDYERLEVWLFSNSAALEAFWEELVSQRYLDWNDTSNLVGVATQE
jgi:hypothetical protein